MGTDSALDSGRLELKAAELERRLEETTRELERESLARQDLEERVSVVSGQLKTLEEVAGRFQREAAAGAAAIVEFGETLRVADQARARLVETLDRQSGELIRWRKEGSEQKIRADALEKKLAQTKAALDDLEKLTGELRRTAAEREKLIEDARLAMQGAEEIRREGIEALEKAQELQKKKPSA